METVGFGMAILVGISLGLVGGGGSVLTIPILVYLFGIEPVYAAAYSLFIVGVAALLGVVYNWKKGLVNVKMALMFAFPSLVMVYFMRLYLVPNIPDELFSVKNFIFTKNSAIMALFIIVVLAAALLMIRPSGEKGGDEKTRIREFSYPTTALEGVVVGFLAGAIGTGGGFLIVPNLVLRARLPTKVAIGTSLLIISINSVVGFIGDLQNGRPIQWEFLLSFTIFVVVGLFIGGHLSNYISNQKLKKGFGWFMMAVVAYVTAKEFIWG